MESDACAFVSQEAYNEMVGQVMPLRLKNENQRIDIRRKNKRLEQQEVAIHALMDENNQLIDNVEELRDKVGEWKAEADRLREQIENHDMCDGCEHNHAVLKAEQRAEALVIEVTALQEENNDLKKTVERLKRNRPVVGRPARVNPDFDDAVKSMETKVLPDGPGEDTGHQERDRFDGIVPMMAKHKVGKSYKAERLSPDRMEFRKRGCSRILVTMPSIKSVPQWSVNGEPRKGIEDAIEASRVTQVFE
ncbi:hypothetical protein SAMN04488579_11772 [Eubacterium barkeri]|uniref:Uncharacterized protein n=2 Tax=Eubacterium barkeri TaxID=1528 RepID=A0A1H3HEV8_EUBBA|nr:hypothetical protein SAMN04488579_11772 [Eubacterium barkeri]